jgi:hypothetical protein
VEEKIDTLYGNDEILKTTLWLFDSTHKTMEGCIGKDEVAMHVTHELIWSGLLKLKQKGVDMRVITQITSDNLTYCKTLSDIVEVRHVDGIQSSFGICDGKWLLDHVISLDEFPLSHAIFTNVEKLVNVKRSLFETVWKQSVPAQEVFAKLEKFSPVEVNINMDTDATKNLLFNLITNSKYHIDMTIPTCNCLQSLNTEGLSNYLKTATNQGVKVRILLPEDERSFELKNSLNLNNSNNIEVKQIENMQSKRIMVLIDNLHSFVMEIKEAKGDTLKSVIKNSVYSTSSITLMTLSVLFEKMWT